MNTEQEIKYLEASIQHEIDLIDSCLGDKVKLERERFCLSALRAQQERERPNGCGYCEDGVYYDVLGSPCKYNFCPMCGRKFEPKEAQKG